jgi:hypothetical protein
MSNGSLPATYPHPTSNTKKTDRLIISPFFRFLCFLELLKKGFPLHRTFGKRRQGKKKKKQRKKHCTLGVE